MDRFHPVVNSHLDRTLDKDPKLRYRHPSEPTKTSFPLVFQSLPRTTRDALTGGQRRNVRPVRLLGVRLRVSPRRDGHVGDVAVQARVDAGVLGVRVGVPARRDGHAQDDVLEVRETGGRGGVVRGLDGVPCRGCAGVRTTHLPAVGREARAAGPGAVPPEALRGTRPAPPAGGPAASTHGGPGVGAVREGPSRVPAGLGRSRPRRQAPLCLLRQARARRPPTLLAPPGGPEARPALAPPPRRDEGRRAGNPAAGPAGGTRAAGVGAPEVQASVVDPTRDSRGRVVGRSGRGRSG